MEVTNETFMAAVADACRAGIESEQERIIKLLEPFSVCTHECDDDCSTRLVAEAIRLIKKEK